MPETKPTAPAHLRADTAKWWLEVVREYELEPHHVKLLTLAAEALDRAAQAREAIAKDGAYIPGRYEGTVRAHPAIVVERDSRLAFARLVRELGLDADPKDSRPPRIAGRY
jgi:P27 family predicted phage terminase small subunit